ncbi:MAG: Sir2 family NAD-dependent protein deacetylase [Pseudomonadota bacterium]
MGQWKPELEKAATILSRATRVTVSTGAGISAESSIPTFRDPGGLWDQISPMDAGTAKGLLRAFQTKSRIIVPILMTMLDRFEKAEPNAGHKALFDLEKMGIVRTVITQNVDNLHKEAGTTDLIEVHGNLFKMVCLSCGWEREVDRKPYIEMIRNRLSMIDVYDLDALLSLAVICDQCRSVMRPDVVMFGEAVKSLPRAFRVSAESDVMLVLGTSGVVFPAASFPVEAKKAGARIIVINPTENGFRHCSDIYISMKAGDALPAIVGKITGCSG